MPSPARLDADQRAKAWERLGSTKFDVLVIGGGVTGAGAALDAATRGLSVALVEARDFASGTSSRSSKLFHGGLRYLEQFNFGLVREALHERELMLTRIAPHLVKPVSFLYPLTHRVWERPYVSAGMTLYDSMGGAPSVPASPALHPRRRTAHGAGPEARRADRRADVLRRPGRRRPAHAARLRAPPRPTAPTVLNSAEVVALHACRRAHRRCTRPRRRDRREVDVKASVVVNCTGVWTDDIQTLAGGRGRFHVRASKGVHIVVPRDRINSETGLILRTEKSVLFVIPWGTHWIVGTTDTDWTLHKAHPAASQADIDYILEHVNAVLVDAAHARRHPGRVRRPAPAAVGRERVDLVAVARARRRPAAARADLDRGRQVHDLPGDGRRRDRRRARGRRRWRVRRASPSTSRWSAPRATTRWSTRSTGLPRGSGCRCGGCSGCSTATAR